MQKYAQKVGKSLAALKFLYDGVRIQPTESPIALGIEHKDQIDVVRDQEGGAAL